jgi:hypothetical protein
MTRRYTDQALVDAVRSSFSIRQVLKILGLSPTSANYIRLLCPNCNSQQATVAGKNWGRYATTHST